MTVSDNLKHAVENKDITAIHSILYTIAHEDPGFQTSKFKDTLSYVKSKRIDGVIEPHDGRPFLPEEEWDEKYWALVASQLQDNFSEERIDHLIKVGKKLFGKSSATGESESSGRSTYAYSGGSQDKSGKTKDFSEYDFTEDQKKLLKGLGVAAAITFIVWLLERRKK